MKRGLEAKTSKQRVRSELESLITELSVGSQLPTVRELIQRYHASPVTISAVIAELTQEGLVYTRPGAGTFVSEPRLSAQELDLDWQTVTLPSRLTHAIQNYDLFQRPRTEEIPFGNGYLDETLQPTALLTRALKRASTRPDLWGRTPPEGLEALRIWFAGQLSQDYRASDVLVFPGGQVALVTLLRSLMMPGAPLLVESPTYFGVLAAARAAGVEVIPVPADRDGIRPELLKRAFQETKAKLLYVQPLHSNPTGAVLAEERRTVLIEAAAEADAFIIEDDYARELTFEGAAPAPLALRDPGRVLYLRSLTKLTAPGLRVAGLSGRGPVMTRLKQARMVESFFMSATLQETALQLVTSQEWPRHLKTLRAALQTRRDTLVSAFYDWPEVQLAQLPRGGYNAWLRLPEHFSDQALVEAASKQGVQLSAGTPFFAGEAPGNFVRLSYASTGPQLIHEGISRLRVAFHSLTEMSR